MRVEDLPIPKPPYIKGKNFNPSPVVTHGIPTYADKTKDPRVEGTPEYEKWWTEQLYRCINGYQTGGIFIPGRFYYYMNFNSMSTIHGIINPDYCDLHLQIAYIIDWCKANNKNVVIGKKRRAGVSEAFQKMLIDYGYRFQPAYHGGIAAGKKVYADDFMTKWEISESLLVHEFKINALFNNSDVVVSGYEVIEDGKPVQKGIKTELYVRTMHSDPNMFKGLYLNDCVVEEAGEFYNFDEFYSATKDCLKDGDVQVGIMVIFGTGGNINKGSKDFKKVWENPNDYNCVKFCITGDRFKKPYYGGATRYGKDITKLPYLSKSFKPYQLLGCEDTQAALEDIHKERELLKKGELKKYLEHLQNNPINESEIFRKMFSNNFDIQKLNEQSDEIAKNKNKYTKFKLEWVLDDKGVRTGKVKVIPAKDTDDESECILILDGYHPKDNFKNLFCAGIDPYDQDEAKSSKSLGAMCVIIRKNNLGGLQMAPVATICTRPKRKEIFFDMCLKLAVYYNLIGATLGDKAGSSGIITWFKDNGFQKLLALRPTKFESENSEQSHEYWVSLNKTSKPLMIGLMQTNVYDRIQDNWFPDLIDQIGNYDDVEIGSDNDLADAYGIALMQDVSTNIAPRDDSHKDKKNPFVLGGWEYNDKGILVPVEYFNRPSNPEKDFEQFGR